MFETLKNKIHSFRVSKVKPVQTGFVNPYTPKGKINPYASDYGTKKPKSIGEIVSERFKPQTGEVPTPVVAVEKGMPFHHTMKSIVISDAMFVAAKFNMPLKRKEKVMSAEEIARACENTKWQ
jgi:hypothetical protein